MSDRLTEEQEASLQSMITSAMASAARVEGLQLPWEEPVFKTIFSSGDQVVPDAVMPVFCDQPFCDQIFDDLVNNLFQTLSWTSSTLKVKGRRDTWK